MNYMGYLTVIVSVYNCEQYIKRCLDSIIENRESINEVILVDDGSPDNSAVICKEYQTKYDFIKYFYQENSGPSAARNKGLELANSEYIMFMDSDDYIGSLKTVDEAIKKYKSDYYVFPNMHIVNNKPKEILNLKEDKYSVKDTKDIIRILVKEERINSPCAKVFKKEIIQGNNIKFNSDYNMAEDLLFNMEYLNCCENFVVNSTPFYYYCFNNSESLTQKYLENKYEMLMAVNAKLKPIFQKLNISDMYDYLVYKNTFSSIKDFWHKDCKLNEREKRSKIKKYRKEINKKFIFNKGLKMLAWSTVFNLCPVKMVCFFTKIGG